MVAQICGLLRYTVLARFLGPEQLGIAAALILTGQFFDSISDSNGDRFLIQDKDGDSPDAQRLAQLSFVVRGTFLAVLLVALAGPIAALIGVKVLVPGIMTLGLSSFIVGFLHLDIRRAQRHHNFLTDGYATLFSESFALIGTVAAAYFLRNYMAVLFGIVIRPLVIVIVSHLRAKRKYELGYVRKYAGRLAQFSIPLMINGLFLFFGGQSDRILIGRELGLTELGKYSAVLLLIYYPSALVQRNLAALHLPRVAKANRDFQPHAEDDLVSHIALLAMLMLVGFAAVAPTAIHILYGQRFVQPILVVAMIGALQAARFMRQWPTTAALAAGDSRNILWGNILRLVGVPGAILSFALGGGIEWIVASLIFGEIFALGTSLLLLNRTMNRAILFGFSRYFEFGAACALLLAIVWMVQFNHLRFILFALILALPLIYFIAIKERRTIDSVSRLSGKFMAKGLKAAAHWGR